MSKINDNRTPEQKASHSILVIGTAPSLAELRAEYQSATAAYYLWTIIEDRLSDRERREKEAASARVDRAWAALQRAKRSSPC